MGSENYACHINFLLVGKIQDDVYFLNNYEAWRVQRHALLATLRPS